MSKNVRTANVRLSKAKLSDAKPSCVNLRYLNKSKPGSEHKTKNITKTKSKAEQPTVLCRTTSLLTFFGFYPAAPFPYHPVKGSSPYFI